jgi:hypothetical protein
VLGKSFAGLLGPLDWKESSPPGFLVLEKLAVSVLGSSEYALRAIPFLAGVAGVIAFAILARRVCGQGASWLWAVLLLAVSAKVALQASQVKHFTFDVLSTVLLTGLAIRSARSERPLGGLLGWGIAGAVGIWLSYASLFVFIGSSLVLLSYAISSWGLKERLAYLFANLAVLISLGALLAPIKAQLAGPAAFWAQMNAFPDTRSVSALMWWLGWSHLGMFNYIWRYFDVLVLALVIVGAGVFWRSGRRSELLILWLPVWTALAAAFFHRWPFGGNQHMVFAAPAVLLLAAEGLETVRQRLQRLPGRIGWAGWVAVAVVLLPGIVNAVYHMGVPRHWHDVRPVIEFVQRYLEPHDQLLVTEPATFEYYTGRNFRNSSMSPDPSSRVWFITLRAGNKQFSMSKPELFEQLRVTRPQLNAIEEYGAAAYLFGPVEARSPQIPLER